MTTHLFSCTNEGNFGFFDAKPLRRHGVGYLAYGLWASPVSDLHPAALGPVGGAGNMCFVNPDGARAMKLMFEKGRELKKQFPTDDAKYRDALVRTWSYLLGGNALRIWKFPA